jgi:hypothetical protein
MQLSVGHDGMTLHMYMSAYNLYRPTRSLVRASIGAMNIVVEFVYLAWSSAREKTWLISVALSLVGIHAATTCNLMY